MKIGIIGYGKMGKMIEEIAISRGHELIITDNLSEDKEKFYSADVAIEFTTPDTCYQNLRFCISKQIPIVSGTTGWLHQYDELVMYCKEQSGCLFYASNFSLGANLFFKFNKKLAEMMKPHHNYKASIKEVHHTQKKDRPSGTAVTIAKGIIENSHIKTWVVDDPKKAESDEIINIQTVREGDIFGIHTVKYTSDIDNIKIEHESYGRKGYALGSVIAAEWIQGKQGVFSMEDLLKL